MKSLSLTCLAILAGISTLMAAPNKGISKREQGLNKTAAGCNQTTATIDLDVNNVRARLMNGGDMWWDRPTASAAYEVPKGSNKNALFAGSIWIGGKDASGSIKVAAQTYRQSGNDYWSGPLDGVGNVDFQTCADWDRFWKISASDISLFRNLYLSKGLDPTDTSAVAIQNFENFMNSNASSVPAIIKEWPSKGNNAIKTATGGTMPVYTQDLAEFVDVNPNDGDNYNWKHGDYPRISGDQYIWWVFNDKGDAKTETTSESMDLEIHAAAFAFATNDCLNEATFYNYKIRSKSTFPLFDTYMATWCDADLGNAFDDYVGCDTARGLGILYNGDSYDDGAGGYGFEIPMIGVDYFQGPTYRNPVSGLDTELKMTVFTYYDNEQGLPTGNPDVLDDYYQFITGFWKDGQPFTVSNNARNPGPVTKFIFYGDPCKGGWTEASSSNTPNDRRFIHSSGPFPLEAGAKPSNITIGAVWVPNVGGGKSACFSKIQICDDKAQDLFNNNFKLPFGPNAPNVVVQPLDKKLVFDMDNLASSNNFGEKYGYDTSDSKYIEISKKATNAGYQNLQDIAYQFEGYLVYQLKNSQVALSDIRTKDGSINTDKARLVFQCDKKNGIKQVVNFEQNPDISETYFVPKLMVEGEDKGITHSFQITQDAFATGTSKNLVNYKYYYYVAIAYARNNFKNFDAAQTDITQDRQYLESRTDGREQPIKVIKAMPHPANDSLYIQNYADFGTGLQLTRQEGIGNNGTAMELSVASEEQALQGPNYKSINPTYKPNLGPMRMIVVNPDSLKPGNYEVWFKVDSSYSKTEGGELFTGAVPAKTTWSVRRINGSQVDTVYNEVSIQDYSEKYLRKYNPSYDWGLSGAAVQQIRPGDNPISTENGFISSDVLFEDVNNPWLSGVADEDGESFRNWIRAGSDFQGRIESQPTCTINDYDNVYDTDSGYVIYKNADQLATFEKVLSGTFAPYNLVTDVNLAVCGWGLMYNKNDRSANTLQKIYSIDIVFTSDKSKWSRCPVIEMTDNVSQPISQGGAFKYNRRRHEGWIGEYNADGSPKYSTNSADSGMSLFPGYAINIETGERLNICFGEESFNVADNGSDMLWNPTSRIIDDKNFQNKWGGRHIIYVSRTKYDGGAWLSSKLSVNSISGSKAELRDAFKTMMWVGVPVLKAGSQFTSIEKGLIPNTTRVKVRVTRPYAKYSPYDPADSSKLRNNGWPLYTFSTNDMLPAKLGDAANNYTANKDEIFKRISVVPNPYYAYSEYEENRLENKVRIINLPDKATIKIFTTDGILIKTIRKSDSKTSFVDWDIKNEKGIPIASGMYLVHVQLDGIGETILKWFGAMRTLDITSF